MQLLLDRSLGVVTEINCKSGLDRTGFVRALERALMEKVEEVGVGSAYDFLLDFETRAQHFDAALSAVLEHRGTDFDYQDWLKNQPPKDQEVARFQSRIWAELCAVGVPITARSSGLPGLKWHFGKKSLNPFEKNCHPLPFLPRIVGVRKGNKIEWTEMVQLKNGIRRTLTPTGILVLMGLSRRRGG
jgi:hypothetical protein